MLETMEDMKKAELEVHPVINGVDNPNLRSVDSTAVIETPVDRNPGEEPPAEEPVKEEKKEVSSEEKEEVKEPSGEDAKDTKDTEEEKTAEAKAAEKDAVQKRINELTRKFRTAERELNYERKTGKEKVEQLQTEIKELKKKFGADEDAAPNRDDFDSDETYYIALADWRFDQRMKELVNTAEPTSNTKQQSTSETHKIDKVLDKGTEKYEDFDELVHSENFTFTQEMADIILQGENEEVAADILYHLSKNRDLAEKMSEMSPAKIAREIGKLEILVTKEPEEKEDPEKKEKVKTSSSTKSKPVQSPEPITPVRTTGGYDKDPASMSMKEYKAWRKSKNK